MVLVKAVVVAMRVGVGAVAMVVVGASVAKLTVVNRALNSSLIRS